MDSPLSLKIQADFKSDTACSYTSSARSYYIWGLWRSNLAEEGVKKESTAPKTPEAKFGLTGQGWFKDNNRPLSVLNSRGQNLSYETHDL